MTTDVTIVVATRNRREQLLALLPRHTAPVIVVDNGSDDGTPAAVAREFPRARVVELVAHHLPVPAGRDPRARWRVEARNRVLTAALRRPGRVLRAVVADAWRTPAGRAGLRDAARPAGWVLRHRRRLPGDVGAALVTLSHAATPLSAGVPEPVPSAAA